MYQGNNTANIDIQPSLHNLTTTQKAVNNAVIKSGIANHPRGSRHLSIENRYAAQQIFALMEINYNMREVRTCRSNRKVFDSEQLLLDKNVIEEHSKYWLKNYWHSYNKTEIQ